MAQPFAAGEWDGKRANADYVRKQFNLAVSRGPIFALVARLVHQKGIDLVLSAAGYSALYRKTALSQANA